jgi:C1A family cysteine protease
LVTSGIALLLLTCSVSASLTTEAVTWLLRQRFDKFKTDYNKVYNTQEEDAKRFEIFKENLERAVFQNFEHKTTVFGVTQFSDLTQEEFKGFLNFNPREGELDLSVPVHKPKHAAAAGSYDWRDYGAVTPVKNQGYCGSCWAFSATETIESAYFLEGNPLTEFSVEQIVQCDTYDSGCNGGWPYNAYKYVEGAGGLATEADYPYTSSAGETGTCDTSFSISGGTVTNYTYATTPCSGGLCRNQDEDTLISNLASTQPVSVCVDASSWSSYTGGIFPATSCSGAYFKLDHCVQLVGYTNYQLDNSYYLVRNSWGTSWGESGYIYLPIGDNACGIADVTTTVTVA